MVMAWKGCGIWIWAEEEALGWLIPIWIWRKKVFDKTDHKTNVLWVKNCLPGHDRLILWKWTNATMSEVWPLSWHDCYTVEESPTNVISAIFLHLKNESEKSYKDTSWRKSNKCGQRNFTTSKIANLKNHMKIHSGRRSNKCGQCKFAIAQAARLRNHMRVHSWEKPNKYHHCMLLFKHSGKHHLQIYWVDRTRTVWAM